MKYLKRFLESAPSREMSEEDILLLLDDVQSLHYIFEEEGFDAAYEPIFAGNSGRFRTHVGQIGWHCNIGRHAGYGFFGFRIEIWPKNPMRTRLGLYTVEQKEILAAEAERYCDLLREHLEYPGSKFKSVRLDSESPDFNQFKNAILVEAL